MVEAPLVSEMNRSWHTERSIGMELKRVCVMDRPTSAGVTLKEPVAVSWAEGLRRKHGDRRCAGGSLGLHI